MLCSSEFSFCATMSVFCRCRYWNWLSSRYSADISSDFINQSVGRWCNQAFFQEQDLNFKTKTKTKCSRPRLLDPRPRLSFLSSRRLETPRPWSRGLHHCCWVVLPRAGSGVVRIDPLRFLAGCRTRRLNQACLSYILAYFIVLLFIRASFYVLLVFVAVCSVFWLFWLSCHYLPSDWLEDPSEEA